MNHRRSAMSSIMSCWTDWRQALQKHGLPADVNQIYFHVEDPDDSGMWGYWTIDGSLDFRNAMHFRKDGRGDWQGDDEDLAFIVRS